MIRNAVQEDTSAIVDIYNYYILHTFATFEEKPLTRDAMWHRIQEKQRDYPWLVFEENKEVLGYAYATKWRSRPGYRFSVESTVYVKDGCVGQGIGTQLYKELLQKLKDLGVKAIMAGICLPNQASVVLHERFGFEQVAQFKRVGVKFDRWHDVGYWELQTEKDE